MIPQVNPDSAQTVVGESGPVVSANDSEPPRYQVFHIEHSPNVHKIFIPTGFPRPAGYLYFVTDLSLQDHPETTLPVTADVLKSSEQMGDICQSRFVGYIASQDLDRMRAMIKEYSRPLGPDDYAPLPDYATRCEVWVRAVVATLLNDGILEAPPPEPAAPGGHRLPRHHHTAHCIHQRLHSYHPYRRRSRQPIDQGH
ncbi:hypothetical protein NXS19_005746 [Fusarium pseudograminearum]|uniref:Uncharacterized protein n=2 Tax=Fusarium pseudograminearum TaxID=101028 RepID=K3VCW3_FUSPC|nr:hypothetical protein FPSE_08198 [Fusarium pseudograminearum CS3096]EKJ71559.1 hypothetical protein FPSE_08198 [Fusarium pseudograminearum CS3096]KAF0636067.1 hypothetical protein FPSE5266_08198 [Fusarium pseudograminearum]UZP37930.1 hypothetical protein NXS19_005746 [Fusarium pseudograminearum]CEG02806.1 unnamed protein product [Fusarium pseudograminearum CS3487]